jgi:hypothetical protein
MTIAELKNNILQVCPDAQFETRDAEVIVKTRLRVLHDGTIVDYDNPEAIYAGSDESVEDGSI